MKSLLFFFLASCATDAKNATVEKPQFEVQTEPMKCKSDSDCWIGFKCYNLKCQKEK